MGDGPRVCEVGASSMSSGLLCVGPGGRLSSRRSPWALQMLVLVAGPHGFLRFTGPAHPSILHRGTDTLSRHTRRRGRALQLHIKGGARLSGSLCSVLQAMQSTCLCMSRTS
jgi:hypothetical protein